MGELAWKRKAWRRPSRRYECWTREVVPGLWFYVGRDFEGEFYYHHTGAKDLAAASLGEAADKAEAEAVKLLERGLAKLRRGERAAGQLGFVGDLQADGALLGALEREDGRLGFTRTSWPLDRPTENCLRRYLNARESLRRRKSR